MIFLFLNNADIEFAELEKLIYRFYTTIEALSTTSPVELIDKIEFANTVLDKDLETFIIYVVILEATKVAEMMICPLPIAQLAALQWAKLQLRCYLNIPIILTFCFVT